MACRLRQERSSERLVTASPADQPQSWRITDVWPRHSSPSSASPATPCGAAAPAVFAPCENGYQGTYPSKQTLTLTTAGAGTRTIASFRYMLRVQRNGRREMFLDHIEATNTTAIGAAHVRLWRDCSNAPNPVTCV